MSKPDDAAVRCTALAGVTRSERGLTKLRCFALVGVLAVAALVVQKASEDSELLALLVHGRWDGEQGVTLRVRFDDGFPVEGLQLRVENIWRIFGLDPDEEPRSEYHDLPADGVLELSGALNGLRVIFQPNSELAVAYELRPGFGEHELVLPSENRVHAFVQVDGAAPDDWLGLPGAPRDIAFRISSSRSDALFTLGSDWSGSRDQVVPGSSRRYGEVDAGFTAGFLGLARQDRLLLVGLDDLEHPFEWFSGVELVPREGQRTPLTLATLPDTIDFVSPLSVVGRVMLEPGAEMWKTRLDVEVDVGGATYRQERLRIGHDGELHVPVVHPRLTLARYEGGQAQVDALFGGMRLLVYHRDSSREQLVSVTHLDVERGANVGVVDLREVVGDR